ncbi:zinc/iron-chelating domain-containing protein, partial [Listeria monocytogenes]
MMKYTFEIDLDRYKNLAQQKQKTHKKFLAGLAKKPPKQLDKIVKEVHEEVFLEIDCTK